MKRRNFEEFSAIVRDFHSSGLAQQAFCDREGLKIKTLQKWITKVRKADRTNKAGGFVEIRPASAATVRTTSCRIIAKGIAFEFDALPGLHWLAGFSEIFSGPPNFQR